MKICLAQIEPDKGNFQGNIEIHKKWIELAIQVDADFIAFPELSLTGYEPQLAKGLAISPSDSKLDDFQNISNQRQMIIAVGLPVQSAFGILIGMVIFSPHSPRQTYSKQQLHQDELPYFVAGKRQTILAAGNTTIAPAICYESLQVEHAANAKRLGANIYLASVAKAQKGIDRAFAHFPKLARKYSLPVLMVNSIGFCDNFRSAGQSAIWDRNGKLLAKLDEVNAGMLILDTETGVAISKNLPK